MAPIFSRFVLCLSLVLPLGCAVSSSSTLAFVSSTSRIEVAFSPEAGSEALVVKVIASAHRSLRLAAYSFTSPAVVKALLDAKKRNVDVQILIDDRGNRSAASQSAIRLITGASIPLRVISIYAIHHDKYIVVDDTTTETRSFNYSQSSGEIKFGKRHGDVERSGCCHSIPIALEQPLDQGY